MTRNKIDRSLFRLQSVGFLSVFIMVGIFGAWSALASINGAVIASAIVTVETYSKKIQHKDGGIIREILVGDGDRVEAAQVLVILDDIEVRAELGIVDHLLMEHLVNKARLDAQRDNAATIEFPRELEQHRDDEEIQKVVKGQQRLFEAKRLSRNAKTDQLTQQIDQTGQQIAGLDAQVVSKDQQLALIADELLGLKKLEKQSLVPRSRVLSMEREQARLLGERGELIASKAGANTKIGEIRLQIIQIDEDDRTESLGQLRDVEAKIAELRERKIAAEARLGRMKIQSPITGVVYQMLLHTIGGVVSPGEVVMLIAPEGDELVLQAQVLPHDIDQVEVGQVANIRFPTLTARMTPDISASVIHVSADTSRADQDSLPFYAVRLRIPLSELAKLEGTKLKPGMPAEAFIQTGARTPLSYLLKPLMDQVAHAFRET